MNTIGFGARLGEVRFFEEPPNVVAVVEDRAADFRRRPPRPPGFLDGLFQFLPLLFVFSDAGVGFAETVHCGVFGLVGGVGHTHEYATRCCNRSSAPASLVPSVATQCCNIMSI